MSNKWRGGPEDYLQSYEGVNVQKGIKRAGNDGLKIILDNPCFIWNTLR